MPASRSSRLAGLHPVLFGVYPVLFLWSQNVGEVRPADVGDVFLAVLGATLAALVALALLFRDRRRAALIVTPVIGGALLYGHVAGLGVAAEVLNGAWLLVTAIALVAALRLSARWIARLDTALLRLGALLVVVSLIPIVPSEVEDAMRPEPIVFAGAKLPTETDAVKRDVYWLVFDRYGSDRSFQLQFDVQNELTPWLRQQGFEVLPDSHANYVATALSMATTLNMTPLDKLTRGVPETAQSYEPVYRTLQSPLVARQFQALGYRYLHLGSWWNPTRQDEGADRNWNADGVSDFTAAVVESSVLPAGIKALGFADESVPSESAKHLKHNTFALDALDRIARESGPKFLLAHVLLPHPPYIFDHDGRYIGPDEAAKLKPADAWERQLDYTNSRLKAFITELLDRPEAERPIIIFQADEGPWPDRYAKDQFTFNWRIATEAELETKFGIMNAWYVPGDAEVDLKPSQTAINTFPILFNEYFGLEYPLLPERIYASSGWRRPYQLIEVTKRLPSLRAGSEVSAPAAP